jgi:hypothetical protein
MIRAAVTIAALLGFSPAYADPIWQMSCRGGDYTLTYRGDIAELIMTQTGKEPTR